MDGNEPRRQWLHRVAQGSIATRLPKFVNPAYGLALPSLAFYVGFALFPMFLAAGMSFVRWDGVSSASWVGLRNWEHFLSDPIALKSLYLSAKVMFWSWIIQTPLSLLLGVYVAGRQPYRTIFSVFYFLPLLFSAVAIALIWQPILASHGPLNTLLGWVSGQTITINWLGDPNIALYAVILVIAWQFIPFHTLLYQAGTRQIPTVLYEAATLDGAGTVQQFLHITLPQLKYTFITSTTLILTGSLTYFDVIYVMTGGGPGYSTRILPLDMYLTAFNDTEIGYGSVLAVFLCFVGVTLSIFLLRVTGFTRMESQAEGV